MSQCFDNFSTMAEIAWARKGYINSYKQNCMKKNQNYIRTKTVPFLAIIISVVHIKFSE